MLQKSENQELKKKHQGKSHVLASFGHSLAIMTDKMKTCNIFEEGQHSSQLGADMGFLSE